MVGSGGDDDEGAVGQIIVAPGVDVHGGDIGQAVTQVHGLPLGLVPVGVDEDQFAEQAALDEAEGAGGAYEAAADDGGFAVVEHEKNLLFLGLVCPEGEVL